jgi:hypothetical protein
MDIPNAFIGKKTPPKPAELSAALGTCAVLWQTLVEELAECGAGFQEWNSVSQKYGWSLRLKRNKRTIVQLSPCKGCFRVMFILGDRAVAAAKQSDLPKNVLKLIADATCYTEGTGIRLMVKSAQDLPSIRKLVTLKLEN